MMDKGYIFPLSCRFSKVMSSRLVLLPALCVLVLSLAGQQDEFTSAEVDNAEQLPPAYGEVPYRLGVGDVLSIQFYGNPNLTRPQVTVAPDGTISYLAAISVPVAGLTIEEARLKLESSLANLYRNPRLIITPLELASSSYTVVGMVKMTGVFAMDSPITVVEAIARAGGTESGLFDRRYVDLADLDRSFLIRDGRRMPVDFRRLLMEGDMTQNIALAPGDYIQIASALANDYYVLGSVGNPGREGFTAGASVVAAITKRQGFGDAAFRERVLVVRGSMTNPEVFVVNVREILRGAEPDFLLEPKDIVYVSNQPWHRPEQIVDRAFSTFLRSVTSTWTSANAPVIFNEPVLPGNREP